MNDPILFYEGEHYMFSNFASFAVEWRGVVWMTSEHAYQAAKFIDESIIGQIRTARSAHDAKKLAHLHEGAMDPLFGERKLDIMKEIVALKLAQHDYIKKKLIATGDRLIVEDSPTDSFWGRGPDGTGENHLGKIWMELRRELQKSTLA